MSSGNFPIDSGWTLNPAKFVMQYSHLFAYQPSLFQVFQCSSESLPKAAMSINSVTTISIAGL